LDKHAMNANNESANDMLSLRYLVGRLDVLEGRVRSLVEHRRRLDADPRRPIPGLYVSVEQVDQLLSLEGQKPTTVRA
jgi:hypothetical protein